MGLLLNVKKFVEFVDVAALEEDTALHDLVSSYGIKSFYAERAIDVALKEGFVELVTDDEGIKVYKIASLSGRYLIRQKFKIPYGVFNYWFEKHKAFLTVLVSAITALAVVIAERLFFR